MTTMDRELCLLLTDCLKRTESEFNAARLASLSPERWQALLNLATTHQVMSLLWHRLRQKRLHKAVPGDVAETLRQSYHHNAWHNLQYYGELRLLLSAFKAENLPAIPLKGMYLAEAVYGNIALREMNDIDMLVRTGDLTRIVEIVTGMGYRPLRPICVSRTIKTNKDLPRLVKNGNVKLEIHWNLTQPNESYSINPAGLWERAGPVKIAGGETLALAPEDLLLYLCVHTSYHHQFAFGLRPFFDIAEAINRFGAIFAWKTAAERAIGQSWQRGVYLALRLAMELADADVPADILAMLQPADMTESVLEAARVQVFTNKRFAASITVSFAELLESRHLMDKIRIFWRRVFLPKALIAEQYSVPMDSVRIYSCYPRRFFYLLRRYGHTLNKIRESDVSLKTLATRTNCIANWLASPATVSEHCGKTPTN